MLYLSVWTDIRQCLQNAFLPLNRRSIWLKTVEGLYTFSNRYKNDNIHKTKIKRYFCCIIKRLFSVTYSITTYRMYSYITQFYPDTHIEYVLYIEKMSKPMWTYSYVIIPVVTSYLFLILLFVTGPYTRWGISRKKSICYWETDFNG